MPDIRHGFFEAYGLSPADVHSDFSESRTGVVHILRLEL